MVKSARRKTAESVITAADRSSKSLQNRSGQATDRDIARRAYELYEQRDREDGHDIDDWLQAERDLRDSVRLHVARLFWLVFQRRVSNALDTSGADVGREHCGADGRQRQASRRRWRTWRCQRPLDCLASCGRVVSRLG